MALPSQIEEWLSQLNKVGGLYSLAALSRAGLLDAYYTHILGVRKEVIYQLRMLTGTEKNRTIWLVNDNTPMSVMTVKCTRKN